MSRTSLSIPTPVLPLLDKLSGVRRRESMLQACLGKHDIEK